MKVEEVDVVIVGAGPAGASCGLSLKDSGLKVAVLDRAFFPRDKICGDALSVDVVNQLPLLSGDLADLFFQTEEKISSAGVRITGPDGTTLDLPFTNPRGDHHGYVFPRMGFDNLLITALQDATNVTLYEGEEARSVEIKADGVEVITHTRKLRASIMAEATGTHRLVPGGKGKIDRRHYSAGLRMYFDGVTGFHKENFIELIFFRDILPGYLWIFPMARGKANVGIGVLSSTVAAKKLNLRKVLLEKIARHPLLRKRFEAATALEEVKGHGLPLGSLRKDISGDRFIRLGDAASLIDPFTGEGIGNAIRSGRVAADHIRQCFAGNTFSASFNKAYDKEIYRRMGREFRLSHSLQHLCKYPFLFNFVLRKANSSRKWHRFLVQSLADIDYKKQLTKPMFYYRMLFH